MRRVQTDKGHAPDQGETQESALLRTGNESGADEESRHAAVHQQHRCEQSRSSGWLFSTAAAVTCASPIPTRKPMTTQSGLCLAKIWGSNSAETALKDPGREVLEIHDRCQARRTRANGKPMGQGQRQGWRQRGLYDIEQFDLSRNPPD